MNRQYYFVDILEHLPDEDEDYKNSDERHPCSEEEANVISSHIVDSDKHMPVLDIDFPAKLIPSSTEGHFHLYLDVEVEWDKYVAVLEAMKDAGILEEGFVDNMIRRGATFVRKEGVYKQGSTKALEAEVQF